MQSSMLLQVHDELVFETTPEEQETLTHLVEEAMIEAARVCGMKSVPVEVDSGAGKTGLMRTEELILSLSKKVFYIPKIYSLNSRRRTPIH